jgi:hypothetical protein
MRDLRNKDEAAYFHACASVLDAGDDGCRGFLRIEPRHVGMLSVGREPSGEGPACIPLVAGEPVALQFQASWGGGWDHVSVSLPDRCPTWDEMCRVKEAFFLPEECVMELHPQRSQYVNCHPFCLHLWRPQAKKIPMPPREFVG